MKDIVCTITGIAGSIVTGLFGGWTSAMTTLLIFMSIDYISGLAVAGVFKKSKKSDTGALDSRAGWKGLCKKSMIMVFVLVGYRLDVEIGTHYIKDAVCIGFMANELISIVENGMLMGLPIPTAITNCIDILKDKADMREGGSNEEE
ncbi:MAG: phage holin family protein [Eubacterium sp.]|nr:phage holin family protein [Eubacterium sp.]